MDFGKSKIRVGAINKEASKKNFFYESNYFTDYSSAEIEIEKIITNRSKVQVLKYLKNNRNSKVFLYYLLIATNYF